MTLILCIFLSIILQVKAIEILVPQNNGTIVKQISVNGTASIYSYGYPDPIVTTNIDLDANPLSLDWNLTSSNGMDFVVFFDRLDLDRKDGDQLVICDQQSYAICAKSPSSAQCGGIQVNNTVTKVEWKIERGPMFVVYHPVVPKVEGEDELIYVRSGYRATVLESDPMSRKYLECNTTYDIRDNYFPFYVVSQGYPYQATSFLPCTVTIVSDGGIRVRVPIYNIDPKDSLVINGGGTTGKRVIDGFDDAEDSIYTLYYYQNVTITAKMQQSSAEFSNYYVIYAQPYDVTPSICDVDDTNYADTSFQLQTEGYDSSQNYITNLNCTYTVSNMAENSQLMLQIYNMDMESGADWFIFPELELKLTGRVNNYVAVAPLNLSSASVSIISDGLDSRHGVQAYVHKLDCTCNGGTFQLQKGVTTSISMPVTDPDSTANTYCKGIKCTWNFIAPPGVLTELIFLQVDVSYGDDPEIMVDGKFFDIVREANTWGVFNQTNITLSWSSNTQTENYFPKGFQVSVQADDIYTDVVDLCNTSIVRRSGDERTVRQTQYKSCKGFISLQVFDIYSIDLLDVFDGDFVNGTKMTLKSDVPNVARSGMLSVRINHNMDAKPSPYDFVVSDSFTDKNGTICGGIIGQEFSYVPGCIQVFNEQIVHFKLIGQHPLTVYKGVSIAKKDMIPTSDSTLLDLYTPNSAGSQWVTLTFQIPIGFTGARYETEAAADEIEVDETTNIILASTDYLNKKCTECALSTYLIYTGDTIKLIHIELLENLGDSKMEIIDKWYYDTDGLVNISLPILPNPSIDYYPGGEGQLIARIYTVDAPMVSTVMSTTMGTTTAGKSMTSPTTTMSYVSSSTSSSNSSTTMTTAQNMQSTPTTSSASSASPPSPSMFTTSAVPSTAVTTVVTTSTTMSTSTTTTTKAPPAVTTTTTPIQTTTTIPDDDKSSTQSNYLLSIFVPFTVWLLV